MHISKKHQKQAFFVSILYIFLLLIVFQFIYHRGISQLKDIYILNIGMDILAMVVGFVLYICCLIDIQKTGESLKYLLAMTNVTFIGLFSDACAWLVDEVPSLRYINALDNTLYDLCGPVEAFFFWMYVMTYLKVNNELVKKLSKVVKIGLYFAIIARFVNLFTGVYFTVDASGVYHRSQYCYFSTFFAMFTLFSALIAVVIERKQLERYQFITFFIYGIGPLVSGIITIFIYGISLHQTTVMISVLMMYCVLNVAQGREKAVEDRDLMLASAIQENILPKSFPFLPDRKEFDLYASMTPAKEVGGDFYDFFMVDDDHIALVMADVSGKGIPAALFMMAARTMIKNRAMTETSPAKILYDVNNQLCEGNKLELFVTVWLAIIELSTGKGVAANAGHEHPAIKRNDDEYHLEIYRHSPAVATIEGINFKEHEFVLNPGESLFVYTDGVPEATNSEKELFGNDRMLEALNKNPDAMPKETLDNVMAGIGEFVQDSKQFDDITMLCIKYFGNQ